MCSWARFRLKLLPLTFLPPFLPLVSRAGQFHLKGVALLIWMEGLLVSPHLLPTVKCLPCVEQTQVMCVRLDAHGVVNNARRTVRSQAVLSLVASVFLLAVSPAWGFFCSTPLYGMLAHSAHSGPLFSTA